MKIEVDGEFAYIYTPYNAGFVERIKRFGSAKWIPEKKAWRVNAEEVPSVREIMQDVYGETDIFSDLKRCDAKLTFHKSVSEKGGGVYFFGKCLARSYGPKSNVEFDNGVCYLEGKCTCTGGRNSWSCVVDAGSVVMLYDVPETLVRKEKRHPDVDYEIFERVNDNRIRLEREKRTLLARIAEIDALLQNLD